jgi:uncharacterized phage protein gp47/JayE
MRKAVRTMKVLRFAVVGTAAVAAPVVVTTPIVNALTMGTSWVRVDAVDNGNETVTLRVANLDKQNTITCAIALSDAESGASLRSDLLAVHVDLAPGGSTTRTRDTEPGHYRVGVRCDNDRWRYTVAPGGLFTVSARPEISRTVSL